MNTTITKKTLSLPKAIKKTAPAKVATAEASEPFDPVATKPLIQHLLDAENPNINDPYFPLFAKYEAWEIAERRRRSDYRSALGADSGVPRQEAQRMWEIGRLEAESPDFMYVHTKEALRLFIGRGTDPDGKVARIPGAKNIATALRHLWIRSGQDNPYADWALLMAEEALDERIAEVEAARARASEQIKLMEQRGIHISLLRSANPVKIDLGFKSPYGFLIAQLIVAFDEFVRVVKTLQSRDLLSSDEARLEIRGILRPLRALFDQILKQQAILSRPVFSMITRPEFKATSKDIRKRVSEIQALWPGLPDAVLSRELLPRHARRPQGRLAPVESGKGDEDGLL